MDTDFMKAIEGSIKRSRAVREDQIRKTGLILDSEQRRKANLLEEQVNAILKTLPECIESAASKGFRWVLLFELEPNDYINVAQTDKHGYTNRVVLARAGTLAAALFEKLSEYEPTIWPEIHKWTNVKYYHNDSDRTDHVEFRVYFLGNKGETK